MRRHPACPPTGYEARPLSLKRMSEGPALRCRFGRGGSTKLVIRVDKFLSLQELRIGFSSFRWPSLA